MLCCVADVVVEVSTHSQVSQRLTGELFCSPDSTQGPGSPMAAVSTSQGSEAPPTRVREPPQPRMPTMNASSGSEVK